MDLTLPLDKRAHSRHQPKTSSSSTASRPGDGRKQEVNPQRSTTGYSPLPSTSTMPLSLQQLGSAASSTDSLNAPAAAHGSSFSVSRPLGPRHVHSGSQTSVRTEPLYSTQVSRPTGQATLAKPQSSPSKRPAHNAADSSSRPTAGSPSSNVYYGYKRSHEPSPSIYSGRSTSSAASLPPASESSLSASTVMYAHSDPKGKARATLTSAVPVPVSSRRRVPSEIADAVRNLGLAPPGTPSLQDTPTNSPYLSIPGARAASRSAQSLSRSLSAENSAASISDGASLSGTFASSIASTSQDAHSISTQSSKKSATSQKKVKKKKSTKTMTTSIIASSTSPPPASIASSALVAGTSAEVKPKKKKKKPLPTSSGKPAGTSRLVPAAPPASMPVSQGVQSQPPIRPTAAPKPVRPSRPAVSSHPSTQSTVSHPGPPPAQVHRPAAQAAPSRNRHLDESAALRTFPSAPLASISPISHTHSASTGHASAARPTIQSHSIDGNTESNEPPPPPWTAPATTITLAFTPMHAYLSAYHDPAEQSSTPNTASAAHPSVPDSPPPAFRSRSPSPVSRSLTRRRTSSQGSTDDGLPSVDLDALEERSRGYASSENELDLLNSLGRHSGTATPPLDTAHGASSQGLRWQLRHWEAWRREGITMEERLSRLKAWHAETQSIVIPDSPGPGVSALLPATSSSSPIPVVPSNLPSVQVTHVPPAGLSRSGTISATGESSEVQNRLPSPVRSDLSPPSGSGTSQPRFPSVGTVRRARLQRFEAERQRTRSMADVVQSSPTASSVSAPRIPVSQGVSLLQETHTTREPDSLMDSQSREQVRLAMLQAALERRSSNEAPAMRSTQMPQQLASEAGTPASPRNQVEEQAYVATGPDERSSAQLNEDKNSAAEPTHQLARQLAAEIEAKQRAASTRDEGAIALGQAPGPESPVISSPNNISSTTQTPPTLSSAKASQSPSRVSAGDVGPSKQLQKAASRISRIFRPNMGPRPQTSRKAEATSVDQVEQVVSDRVAPTEPGQYTDVGVGKVDPVMTLPKAPPRLTTDPLSTDNLRKLSRHQLRSPVTHRADSASTSSSEDDASTSSTSESDKSDTESDSADDESTKKPPSTVSFLGARAPPSLTASTVNGPESEREAAAASWRRTEDGRRHSALLSRPLSIKRKPPPVPPKRWGGVWDRDAIQEKLRKSFNLLEEEEREPGNTIADPTTAESWLSRARSLMPGTLPSVAEDEQAWEVVGQEPTATLVQPSTSWRTVGREENNPSLTDRVQSFLPRTPESSSWTARNRDYVYSEADFSTSRRPPPPPPPRFSASPQPALVNTLDNIGETLVTSSGTRPESPSRVLLQRSAAVRRPNSTLLQRQSFESAARRSPELVRSTPPSPEVRSRLGSRSRHVYSTSTPNASIMTQAPTAQQEIATHAVRRALPPIPSDEASTSSNTQSRSEDTRPPAPGSSSVITASDPPTGIPTQEYTDLEVMLASLDDSSPAATSQVLREVLGVTQPATAEEIDSLPVGRVELERRRVDKKGKIKQKLSCVGINCNKCKICLQQFKEDELAVVLPMCLEVFHAEPCMRAYLATNNRCPSCQAALM